LVDTALGALGVAWSDAGLVRVQLPLASAAEACERLRTSCGCDLATMPDGIAAVAQRLRAHLAGAPQDLTDVALDMRGLGDFAVRVYRAARGIPPGQTRTYGALAAEVGAAKAARAVGRAIGANPFAIVVPCHRVMAHNGRLGGFSAYGGIATKARLLALEGVVVGPSSAG
jgi:methylated-DNA-[protein]-cysteine S-methyltransferase